MASHEGGCLCAGIRYEVTADPIRVTICHCRFCQRATGGPYMVEPIFNKPDFRVTTGTTATYRHRSTGSGKLVHIHFCPTCATRLYLTFERIEAMGIYAGTFDDPNWFPITPANARHIFLGVARDDTIFPAGLDIYREHVLDNDGVALRCHRIDAPTSAADIRGHGII